LGKQSKKRNLEASEEEPCNQLLSKKAKTDSNLQIHLDAKSSTAALVNQPSTKKAKIERSSKALKDTNGSIEASTKQHLSMKSKKKNKSGKIPTNQPLANKIDFISWLHGM
jgi:hypothetical protein